MNNAYTRTLAKSGKEASASTAQYPRYYLTAAACNLNHHIIIIILPSIVLKRASPMNDEQMNEEPFQQGTINDQLHINTDNLKKLRTGKYEEQQ